MQSTGIKVGEQWEQIDSRPDPQDATKRIKEVRVIEITSIPTPSMPVGYRIVRNDKHPHRVGKTGSIRRFDLHRKYKAVA